MSAPVAFDHTDGAWGPVCISPPDFRGAPTAFDHADGVFIGGIGFSVDSNGGFDHANGALDRANGMITVCLFRLFYLLCHNPL